MANLALGYQNFVPSGVITASASTPGLGADQLQNDQGNASAALQIPATSGTITLNYTGSYAAFGLFRTNLSPSGVVTFAVMNGNTVVYSGTALPPQPNYGQVVLVASVAVSGTSVQVTISDPSNPDGFLNIPLMYAGPALQPTRNFDYQSAPGRTNQLVRADTRSGGALFRSDWIKRTFDVSLPSLTPTEIEAVRDMDFIARQGANILLVPNPDAPTIARDALFGEMMPSAPFGYVTQSGFLRSYRAIITERL